MEHTMDLRGFRASSVYPLGSDFSGVSANGDRLSFNNYWLEKNGRPFFPVSGEIHFGRLHPDRWEREIVKMRMAGVNIASTYIFWNHIEEDEGVFDFSGANDLRSFVELCGKHGLYVILRVGPFAHGEARNGGLPDWLYGKPFEARSTDPGFLACVKRLYRQIGQQVRGQFFRDGGPVIAVQLDNEYMHSSACWEITTGISNEWVPVGADGEKYLLALREIALESGLTPVFFTGTAWGGAAYSDRIMPLWGGYAYRPWLFYSRRGEHPATEEYVYQDYHRDGAGWTDDFAPAYPPSTRPYACCEMGGGMMCSYYYRFVLDYCSVDAMANIKLASGCNFLGYYMFHGGTQPLGKHGGYMNEAQVPKRSYDYQAALGEFGQARPSCRRLKTLHLFTRSFGDRLAPMETALPEGASGISPDDLTSLRFAVRTDGESGFLFVNNFQDHRVMPDKKNEQVVIRTDRETYAFDISIASGENAVLPFRFDLDGVLLCQAGAQPVLRTVIHGRPTYVFLIPEGMDGAFRFEKEAQVSGGKNAFTVRKDEKETDVLVLTREEAGNLYLLRDGSLIRTGAALIEDERGNLTLETTDARNTLLCCPPERLAYTAAKRLPDQGPWGVYQLDAEEKTIPAAAEQAAPFRWVLRVPQNALTGLRDALMQIEYRGDVGELFLDGQMISDNFCNGEPWEIGLMEHKEHLGEPMTLKIAPIREGAAVQVESAMAARNETARARIAELISVRVRPVYEIKL